MGSNDAAHKGGHAGAEHDPPVPGLLHGREAELREEVGGPAVCAPRGLELLNGDFGRGFDAVLEGQAGVVEEDGRVAQRGRDLPVEFADLACINLCSALRLSIVRVEMCPEG